MRILLDECVPSRFRRYLTNHEVTTVPEVGWAGVKNGELLRKAAENFDVFLTVDRNLSFQQNPKAVPLPVVVINSTSNKIQDLEKFIPETILLLQNKLTAQIYHIGA